MTADPPVLDGADHDTARLAWSTDSVGAAGAPGVVEGCCLADAVDHAPVPGSFVARTRAWYAVPLVSPVIVVDVPLPVNAWFVHAPQVGLEPHFRSPLLVQIRYCTS